MLKGIAAAASAMLPRIRAQEVIANNLANASTAGFKRDRVFDQSLSRAEARLAKTTADWQLPQTVGIATDFSAGALERTENPLHAAIDGDGFFVVSTPVGDRYTRNGVFAVSADGVLTTPEGQRYAGYSGDIRVSAGDIVISEEGRVSVDGVEAGQLQLVRFTNPAGLMRTSSSLFAATPLAGLRDDEVSIIRQGFIERSNVSTIEEMVDMIATMRIYETDQKAIQIQDDTLGRAINELGRTR
jgi:flagellar basal-body rod protein FlgG